MISEDLKEYLDMADRAIEDLDSVMSNIETLCEEENIEGISPILEKYGDFEDALLKFITKVNRS